MESSDDLCYLCKKYAINKKCRNCSSLWCEECIFDNYWKQHMKDEEFICDLCFIDTRNMIHNFECEECENIDIVYKCNCCNKFLCKKCMDNFKCRNCTSLYCKEYIFYSCWKQYAKDEEFICDLCFIETRDTIRNFKCEEYKNIDTAYKCKECHKFLCKKCMDNFRWDIGYGALCYRCYDRQTRHP